MSTPAKQQQPELRKPNVFVRWLPLIAVIIMAAWFVKEAVPPRDPVGQMKLQEFGALPVVHNGRHQPLDTVARTSLMIISDRQTWYDNNLKERPAIEWLADVMSAAPAAKQHRVFRIENQQLLDTLGLPTRLEPEKQKFRYALSEFHGSLAKLDEERFRLRSTPEGDWDAYDNMTAELIRQLELFMMLQEVHSVPDFASHEDLQRIIGRYKQMEAMQVPHLVPPANDKDQWKPFMRVALETMVVQPEERNPTVQPIAAMLSARQSGDAAAFNKSLAEYRHWLDVNEPAPAGKLRLETMFNNAAPFYSAAAIYVVAFVLACLAWLGFSGPLNRTAFWLIAFGLAIHTVALIARIYLSGRPPVTNLYSAAVFVGWGAVIFGLVIEKLFKLGIGNLVAGVTGFITLLIAHHLSMDGDTLATLQAVLDTNFWLATHVTVVTLGYTATYVAGFLGILYVLRGVLTRSLDKPMAKTMSRMIYGTLCFALLFSFVGTVLGGLWADDSWGRFWGWDPKENGALIIVLWNALILHARWGGVFQQRGMAVAAIFGNVVTSWSFFGVNMLGVGLHSYGAMDAAVFWLLLFISTQMALIAMGLLPMSLWRSFRPMKGQKRTAEAPPVPGAGLPAMD